MVIYLTENIINGKKYIGQDQYNNPNYIGSGILLKKAIKKYGEENFIKKIIDTCSDKNELNEKEIYWIKYYDAVKNNDFYNLAEGGNGGWLGDEVNEKRRKTLTGHKHSEETKNKIRKKAFNRVFSDKTKNKMSNTAKKNKNFKRLLYGFGSNNPNSKEVNQYDLNDNFIKKWDSIKEACEYYNIKSAGNITGCLKGERKTAKGYKWKKVKN
jgi:group I intron endonuclease